MRASLTLMILATVATAQSGARDVALKHRGQRDWQIDLPAEQWRPVGPAFEVFGRSYATALEGTRLKVDTDADGELETALEGETAFVTLRAESETGAKLAWSIRLKNEQGWSCAPGGVRRGKIGKTPIQLIDQDGNGRFDDVGRDALVVGRSKAAAYLSEVIAVDGELLAIRVAADGTKLTATPFDGPVGTLELDCKTDGKVLAAIVQSADGRYSFDLKQATDGQKIPAAEYKLVTGQLGLGKNRVRIETGRSEPIVVTAGSSQRVCWGGPVKAEFAYRHTGPKVHLSPNDVHYYGALGERYVGWDPIGESPKFTITDKDTRETLAVAYFAGSC